MDSATTSFGISDVKSFTETKNEPLERDTEATDAKPDSASTLDLKDLLTAQPAAHGGVKVPLELNKDEA